MPLSRMGDDDLVLDNFDDYNLQPQPHGLSWLRVGNDAPPIHRFNGELIQAACGLFD
jgi:Ni/Co efflux regulator RcnB